MQSMLIASQQQLIRRVNSASAAQSSGQSMASSPPAESSSSTAINNNDFYLVEEASQLPSGAALRENLGPRKSRGSKRSSSWLNLLNPSYKTRYDEFKKLFAGSVPSNERLVVDYSCALQKEILVHGRLYVSLNYICFYANIFKWETSVVIKCRDIASLTKANTARVIPNAIQLVTNVGDKYIFTSFAARDKTYVMVFRIWQNALLDQPMSSAELWSWVHFSYGDDLGFTSDEEEEYVNLMADEKVAIEEPECAGTGEGSDNTSSDENGASRDPNEAEPREHEEGEDLDLDLELDQDKEKQRLREAKKRISTESVPLVSDPLPAPHPPTTCTCSPHEGKQVINDLFPLSPGKTFDLIFSDSRFYRKLLDERKTSNLTVSPWRECPAVPDKEEETLCKFRQLTYTVTINHALAKSASTIETQVLQPQSEFPEVYMVRSEATNSGVPYSDTFCVQTQWCITRGKDDNECHIQVHAQVIFKKATWGFGLMKPLIEKSAMQGVNDYCRDLTTALRKWCLEYEEEEDIEVFEVENVEGSTSNSSSEKVRIALPPEVVRRRSLKRDEVFPETRETGVKDYVAAGSAPMVEANRPGSVEEGDGTVKDTFLLKVILGVLLVLLLLNVLLYQRLWKLEAAAKEYDFVLSIASPSGSIGSDHKEHIPSAEVIRKWKRVIENAISLIKLMEKNLVDLRNNFRDEL